MIALQHLAALSLALAAGELKPDGRSPKGSSLLVEQHFEVLVDEFSARDLREIRNLLEQRWDFAG